MKKTAQIALFFVFIFLGLGLYFFIPSTFETRVDLPQVRLTADSLDGGHSQIQKITAPDGIVLYESVHKLGFEWAYTTASFVFDSSAHPKKCVDWSRVEALVIKLSHSRAKPMFLTWETFVPPHERSHPKELRRLLQQRIPTTVQLKEWVLPISRFEIPIWFKNANKLEILDERTFSEQTCGFGLTTSLSETGFDIKDTIDVSEVKIRGTNPPQYIAGSICLAIAIVLILLLFYKPLEMGVVSLPSPQTIQLKNQKLEVIEKVKLAYQSLYMNPEIDMQGIADWIGIHPKKLQIILREEFSIHHKTLLNQARTQEAHRLLIETDNPVSEIALAVGYSNVTHFNKVFKDHYSKTPSQIREIAESELKESASHKKS
jgi:AraC-like DNA-binding protein